MAPCSSDRRSYGSGREGGVDGGGGGMASALADFELGPEAGQLGLQATHLVPEDGLCRQDLPELVVSLAESGAGSCMPGGVIVSFSLFTTPRSNRITSFSLEANSTTIPSCVNSRLAWGLALAGPRPAPPRATGLRISSVASSIE